MVTKAGVVKTGKRVSIIGIALIYFLMFIMIVIGLLNQGFRTFIASSLMSAAFWTLVLTIVYNLAAIGMHALYPNGFPTKTKEKEDNPMGIMLENVFGEKIGSIPEKLARVYAISTFVYVNMWLFFVSPYSLFGGSLYGAILQLLIALPIGLLTWSFVVSESTKGLFLMTVLNLLLIPTSWMFPTIFSNLYAISTIISGGAPGQLQGAVELLGPEGYRQRYILHQGITEPAIGPSAELVSDEVISSSVSASGRMCDDSNIALNVELQNLAKYQLRDIFVEVKPLRSPELYEVFLGDPCQVQFHNTDCDIDTGSYTTTYCYFYKDSLPKGVPDTLTTSFTTHLFEDVLTQVCTMRTDVVLSYHSTSVFPITFVNYEDYLLYPETGSRPSAINSFGRVRMDIDAGQQPIDDTVDTLVLRMSWEPKGEGNVQDPVVYMYLPPDLGECTPFTEDERISYGEGSGTLVNPELFKMSNWERFFDVDFTCGLECSSIQSDVTLDVDDPLAAVSDPLSVMGKSLRVPGTTEACEDLVDILGYTLCVSNSAVSSDEIKICRLDLRDVNVEGVKKNTYLVRVDSIYDFYDTKVTPFTVENCDVV